MFKVEWELNSLVIRGQFGLAKIELARGTLYREKTK